MSLPTPTVCDCPVCRDMCHRGPCIGTPEDMAKILAAGHGDKLASTLYGALVMFDVPPVGMVAPMMTEKGCVFLTETGLCSLHDSGLKPTEGKLSSCKHVESKQGLDVIVSVAQTWMVPPWNRPQTLRPNYVLMEFLSGRKFGIDNETVTG